jgi:hypothetical protein
MKDLTGTFVSSIWMFVLLTFAGGLVAVYAWYFDTYKASKPTLSLPGPWTKAVKKSRKRKDKKGTGRISRVGLIATVAADTYSRATSRATSFNASNRTNYAPSEMLAGNSSRRPSTIGSFDRDEDEE